MTTNRHLFSTLTLAAGLSLAALGNSASAQDDVTIIEFTQTGCQFIGSEGGVDHGYMPSRKADCENINGQTQDERLGDESTLHLEPGKYIFRVTNTDVPYMLGFYLRSESVLDRPFLPSVSGGGLHQGVTQDYVIELEEGEYVYSCPLNITPDYKLVVGEG
ncbi:MAG: hypothetical protein P8Q36_07340 [Alphaproteobacteria bacterium]|jgi:hypothetical protein|nr:hypothetical protein [Rhodospirillaceae bacterium]MDG2480666.1 hypothetical protein [Alphaproteobacteria bacterium]MBT6205874.1 hypothetical protein [Rhodospirillaceae bacterium]MBT6509236.1 hypothetical protein [Rhodospirillaceae bacterium]MBT7611604.1 hypothetical protein [Rhodospirillaceae bacterium]